MFDSIVALWRSSVRLANGPRHPDPAQPPGAGRQVWIRFPPALKGPDQSGGGVEQVRLCATVQSVNRSAINLVAGRRFEPGSLIVVEVPGADESVPDLLLACVVYVAGGPGGEWV